MCTFVRNKGGDDLRVTRKPLKATHARGENARLKQTCYHCHNPLLRIVKHKRRTYMMPVNNYMAPSPQPVIANDSFK